MKDAAKTITIVAITLMLLTLGPPANAQREGFGERADVVLVQIPVHVSRDGEPLRGLTAENFVVREGRKKQEVVAVDEYDLGSLAATPEEAAAPVPPAARRYFVLLFDLSNSQPAGIVRARRAAFRLATSRLHPSDLVAVATYSQRRGVEIVMSFSTDRTQLLAALDGLGVVDPFDRVGDPLRLSLARAEQVFTELGTDQSGPIEGIRAQVLELTTAALVDTLEDLSTLKGRANRDQVKQQVVDLSRNLEVLARLLDSVSGRKQIVLFSQGFDSEVVFGTQSAERLEEMARSVDFGRVWQVDSDERFGASDTQDSLLAMLERFNRSDAAIHTVDVGGLAAGGDVGAVREGYETFDVGRLDRGHDGLFLMANETGGQFYRNFNDLEGAMDDLLARTSVTYIVSFRPEELTLDGSYHPIRIELEGVGKGVELSHRPGYYARRAFWELDPEERQLANAEQLVAGRAGGDIALELLAAPFPPSATAGEAFADVLTAIEIDGASLIAGQPDNLVPTEIYTYAFDEEGQIRGFLTQAVTLDLYKVGYRLDTGLKLLGHLELAPGKYQLRTLVRNARTGKTGLAVTATSVPDFTTDEPALLPPLFIENEGRWLVGHAEQEGEEDPTYPLMSSEGPLVPASRPRLVNGQQIPMLLVGHALPRQLEAEAHLIGSDGRVQRGIEVTIDRRMGDVGTGERLMGKLLATGVEPGDYRLIVTLVGDGKEISSSLPVFFLALP